jgi:hypothetical protein
MAAPWGIGIGFWSVMDFAYSICLKFCLNGACFLVLIFPVHYPIKGEAYTIDQLISEFCEKI